MFGQVLQKLGYFLFYHLVTLFPSKFAKSYFCAQNQFEKRFFSSFFEKTALMRENFFSKYFEGGGGVDASEANQFFPSQRLLELTLEPFLHILPRYFLLQLKDCILLEACMWLAGRGSMNLDGPSKSN